MKDNVFLRDKKELALTDYMQAQVNGRENLGAEIPVAVYRLLEYSLREELTERFGKEEQIQIFRSAGYRAGTYFAEKYLDSSLEMSEFTAQFQKRLEEFKMGVLRIEKFDEDTGKMVLTVSEDADCSGLPLLGETVCNYDEGFLAGVLTSYTGKSYTATEVNCWATGDRVCRFRADIDE
ncbi:V4R domain-containing protein [Lachnospiraceae bacterium 50-23]